MEGEDCSPELFRDDGRVGRISERKVPIGGADFGESPCRKYSRFKEVEREEGEEHSDLAGSLLEPHIDPPGL